VCALVRVCLCVSEYVSVVQCVFIAIALAHFLKFHKFCGCLPGNLDATTETRAKYWRINPGTQFTCFTSAKVQILTPEELHARRHLLAEHPALSGLVHDARLH
jgi:hypothetical protein